VFFFFAISLFRKTRRLDWLDATRFGLNWLGEIVSF